jgi:enamine deaminase RidA (YjgF/YER057c/UK114 family)
MGPFNSNSFATNAGKRDMTNISSRRNFFGKAAATAAFTAAPKMFAQQPAQSNVSASGRQADDTHRHKNASDHVHDGIYYFSGIGSNDGYPANDHVLVSDPFEKHVTRTMEALKKDLVSQGCTMDSILHVQVFLCLPLSDSLTIPAGKARFDAHKAQYDALNKIYRPYFGPEKAPSRACMAVEWIPGDSLIEVVGSALVVAPPAISESRRD